jgi:hypothetical protein
VHRKCSGVDGVAMDVMVISGGTGDPDRLLMETGCVKTFCSSKVRNAYQNSTCV